MSKRSLILTSISNQGKKLQKTFTDINESADPTAMKIAMQKINALTSNTYSSTDLVEKYNLDTEVPPTRQ